jgi:hypothetical protein
MKLKFPSLYLILLPLYFILFLYSTNTSYLQPVDFIRPAVVSLVLVTLIYLLFFILIRDVKRATLITTIIWTAFSLYGHLYGFLRSQSGLLSAMGKHSTLGVFSMITLIFLLYIVFRSKSDFKALNNSLNILLVGLILIPIFNLSSHYQKSTHSAQPGESKTPQNSQTMPVSLPNIQNKPDIYYIVLDTYSRDDVIHKKFGFDTSPFLDELRKMGFYIGQCSVSNYDSTRVSLASSLNMNTIQNLDSRFVPENPNNAILDNYIIHSRVRATLEAVGYKTIAFSTGFAYTEITDADVYLSPDHPSLLTPNVQPFESLWLKTTALRALFDIRPQFLSTWLNNLSFPHSAHVVRELYALDQLPKLTQLAGPKFVFAHILIPHVPLVFRADGSITKDDRYFRETFDQPTSTEYLNDGYRNQVEFINYKLISIVSEIIISSVQPPIIILQGDHGLLYYEHFPILNAYFFPGNEKNALYPTISPVNSFAVILNEYFGANLTLLPDQSFTSTYTHPYAFTLVKSECPVK